MSARPGRHTALLHMWGDLRGNLRASIVLLLFFLAACAPAMKAARADDSMVAVDGGWFMMGSDDAEFNERPLHEVYVGPFSIDRYEVSALKFAEFLNANGNPEDVFFSVDDYSTIIGVTIVNGYALINSSAPDLYLPRPGLEGHPANNVSWFGAYAYCKWNGKRLPTEAEWEKAARSADVRTYPWGQSPPKEDKSRFGQSWDERGFQVMVPVHELPAGASPYGPLNMAGNVWEWVGDYYLTHYCTFCAALDWSWFDSWYEQPDPDRSRVKYEDEDIADFRNMRPARKNPFGPDRGKRMVLKGGSWYDSYGPYMTRSAYRYWLRAVERYLHTGFRCAYNKPIGERTTPMHEYKMVSEIPAPPRPPKSPPAPAQAAATMPAAKAARISVERQALPPKAIVYFDTDKSFIRPDAVPILDAMVKWLVENPEAKVSIEGHTDERMPVDYNLALGMRRAKSVRAYLLRKGIAASRILGIKTIGEKRGVCFSFFEECWWQNRRATIVVEWKGQKTVTTMAEADTGQTAKDSVEARAAEAPAQTAAPKVEKPIGKDQAAPRENAPVEAANAARMDSKAKVSGVPPRVVSPRDIAEFRAEMSVNFKWEAVPGAAAYELALARDRKFTEVFVDSLRIKGTEHTVTGLDFGTYFFKLRTIYSDGSESRFSDTTSFIISLTPPLSLLNK